METKKEPKYVAETLAWCNARRKEKGKRALKKMPKGVKSDPSSCPCGAATDLQVFTTDYVNESNFKGVSWIPMDQYRPLPQSVQRFVHAFDDGQLPQYEEKQ